MTSLLVTPELNQCLVRQDGIVTVPEELATVHCQCVVPGAKSCVGLVVNDLPLTARTLELELRKMGELFVSRKAIRGYQWVGNDLRLHGPWPSYEFNRTLADAQHELFKRAEREDDPSLILPFVFERNAASPYKDYLLVGDFLKQAVLTEIIVKEAKHG